ncbi:MAG: CHAT domain-containing protein [Deltaproteobacteria bacterium]|nr:CHAT domain-containing protein [Deltaproteobacteria bacterium]
MLFSAVSYAQPQQEEWNKAVTLFNEGQKHINHSDFRGAIEKYEKALSLFQKLGEKRASGAVLGGLGLTYRNLGDYQKAIIYYDQAITIADEIGDKKSKAAYLVNLGVTYSNLKDHHKVIDCYGQAVVIYEEIGDKKNEGIWLGFLGETCISMGNYRKAIEHYEKALAIAEDVGDKEGKRHCLGNIGVAYHNLGDYRKALSYSERAAAIAEKLGDKSSTGIHYGRMGAAYLNLGDYKKAMRNYEQAIAIAEAFGDKQAEGTLLGHMGAIYINFGNYPIAISYMEKSLAIAEAVGNKQGKGAALGGLGVVYALLEDYSKAINYGMQAIAIYKEIGIPYDNIESILGLYYLSLGQYDEAFSIFEKHQHSIFLGMYYLKKMDFKKAKEMFDRGRAKDEKARKAYFVKPRWIGLGLANEGLHKYEEAYQWYKKAVDYMEDQRDNLGANEREHFFKGTEYGFKRIEAYEGAARCAFMLGRLDEAFYWAENTRGRILLELLSRRHAGENYKIPLIMAQEEEDLTTAIMINRKQNQTAFQKNNPELLKQTEDEYLALRQKMEGLIARLRKEYPQYAAIKYPQPVKLSQLALKKGETIIEYEVTDPYTIGLVIRDGKILKGFRVEKTRAELEGLIRKFRSPFTDSSDPNEFSLNLAKELTDLLIKPAMSLLTKGEHLIIIPDESLSLLPFESLLLDAPQDMLKEEAAMLAQAKKLPESDIMDQRLIIRGLSKGSATRGSGLMIAPRVSTKIMFETGSAQISKDSKRLLEEILAALQSKELHNTPISIEGHTDSVGDPGYNLKLSRRRAQAVMEYLTKNGINETRLNFTGKGDTEPVANNVTEKGRKQNRRVDFVRVLDISGVKSASTVSRNLVYAIDEYPISYYQSASVLSLQRGLHTSRMKEPTFFGLGDPVFDTKDQRSAGMRAITIVTKKGTASTDIAASEGTKDAGYRFSRLENTAKEVKEVSRLFPDSRVLIGPDASKNNLKKENLTSRRYVLFSTHGILGNEIPYIKQPALVLTLVGNKEEEGFLTATEIFNMSLNADLVGLSACQTGLGIQSAGEGVVGLSRAFMYAGTDSVLVSLWSVSDESTYKLVVRFFEGLKKGKDKLTALKEAKSYLRASGYDNPFYWAPFILMGESN